MPGEWSRPYHGLSHLGGFGDQRRASVDVRCGFVELALWCRTWGPAFSTQTRLFTGEHAEELAKRAGEDWVAGKLVGSEALASILDELRRLRADGLLDDSNVLSGLAQALAAFESPNEPAL